MARARVLPSGKRARDRTRQPNEASGYRIRRAGSEQPGHYPGLDLGVEPFGAVGHGGLLDDARAGPV